MVFKCAAPGCNTGYNNVIPEGVSLHNFPKDESLLKRWIAAIRRQDYTPGKTAKVCSLHFHESDFVQIYTDTNVTRKRTYGEQRRRRKLKDDAVPSVFPNLPSYLSSPPNVPRSSSAMSESRLERENLTITESIQEFERCDEIIDLTSLKQKAEYSPLPAGFVLYPSNVADLIFTKLECSDSVYIAASVIVKPDLSFIAYRNGKRCDEKHYENQMNYSRRVASFTDFQNLLAFLGNYDASNISPLPEIVTSIESYAQASQLSFSQRQKLEFLSEQLLLVEYSNTRIHGRKYSKATLVIALILQSYSTAAYEALNKHNVLTLPSLSTLRRITKGFRVENSKEMVEYLKLRRSSLTELESVVTLIFDEIYIYETAEYSAGRFFGELIEIILFSSTHQHKLSLSAFQEWR